MDDTCSMPLPGFNETKRNAIRRLCANDDSGLGESVTYVFKNGDQVNFDAQVSKQRINEVQKQTNVVVWTLSVLIQKEHLNYQEPQIGDQLIVRDIRWDAGVPTEVNKGPAHGTETTWIEEGSSWWRVQFHRGKVLHKQVTMQQGR